MWLYVKWALQGLVSIPMTIFAKAICWLLPFFVEEETRKLPQWLSWFDTPNSTADGDPAHQKRHPGTGKWATYKRRTAWYWRNSCYGFDRQVIGVEVYGSDTMTVVGVADAGRRPFKPGACMRSCTQLTGSTKLGSITSVLPGLGDFFLSAALEVASVGSCGARNKKDQA